MSTGMFNESMTVDGSGPVMNDANHEIRLSLRDVHGLVPTLFTGSGPQSQDADRQVTVAVPTLREQMQAGRVTVPLKQLLADVPESFLRSESAQHLAKHVVLPLDKIFAQLESDFLEHGSERPEAPALDELPDVFTLDPSSATRRVSRPRPEPVSAPPPPPAAVPIPDPEPVPGAKGLPVLKLGGIDINQAGPEEMARRLDGVGLSMARRMTENRRVLGAYLSLHDLARVPGIGPKAFTRITGLRWRADANAQRDRVLEVLDISADGQISVEDVAHRFASLPGYDGCIMTSTDGELLAASWQHQSEKALGAFAPQFIKKLTPYIQSLGIGEIDLMTIFISERPFTLIQYESLVFVAVHQLNRFSRRQLRIAQQVVQMLGRLLFRR